MNLTPEQLTDIFDNAVNKSHHVNLRFARVDAMRLVLETIGAIAKADERLKRKRLAAIKKEAVPGGSACQSAEHAVPETTPKGEQR